MNIEVFVEARKSKNFSQSELAEGICTQATLSRFENNNQVPNLKILIKLCERLDLSLGDLFPKVGVRYSETIEKMNRAEFLLITSEYDQAQAILETINPEQVDQDNLLIRYHYLKGFIMVYQNSPIIDTVFQLDRIILSEESQENHIYRLLAYTGMGVIYSREEDMKKAEFYFSKVLEDIYSFPTKELEDTWRVLHIVFRCGVFYADINEVEISNALLNYAISICSDNHVTYYLARAALQLAKNAMNSQEDRQYILELIYDARAYAKINRNSIALRELRQMEQELLEKGRFRYGPAK